MATTFPPYVGTLELIGGGVIQKQKQLNPRHHREGLSIIQKVHPAAALQSGGVGRGTRFHVCVSLHWTPYFSNATGRLSGTGFIRLLLNAATVSPAPRSPDEEPQASLALIRRAWVHSAKGHFEKEFRQALTVANR